MKKYVWVLLLSFLYGGFEVTVLDKLPWWKSWVMVPYWIVVTGTLIALAFWPEKRADRALAIGLFAAFIVLDAGYWTFRSFPHYPFPVYNWWALWWPWNSIWQGHLIGEPVPFLGFPYYYLALTVVFLALWKITSRTKRRSP